MTKAKCFCVKNVFLKENYLFFFFSVINITSPACLAIMLTCSGSFEPKTPVNTAARIPCVASEKP